MRFFEGRLICDIDVFEHLNHDALKFETEAKAFEMRIWSVLLQFLDSDKVKSVMSNTTFMKHEKGFILLL